SAIDIGAVQVGGGALPATLVVDSTADTINDFSPGNRSLRQAVYLANSGIGSGVVTFASSLTSSGPTTLNLGNNVDSFSFGPTGLGISGDVTIQGPTGSNGITISQNRTGGMRLFGVFAGASLTLQFVTLTGGMAQGGNGGDAISGIAAGGGGGAA